MSNIKDIYEKAVKKGLFDDTEESFREMMKDDAERKDYYDHVKRIYPDFYSKDFETFSNNIYNAMTSVADNPAPTTPAEYQANLAKQNEGEVDYNLSTPSLSQETEQTKEDKEEMGAWKQYMKNKSDAWDKAGIGGKILLAPSLGALNLADGVRGVLAGVGSSIAETVGGQINALAKDVDNVSMTNMQVYDPIHGTPYLNPQTMDLYKGVSIDEQLAAAKRVEEAEKHGEEASSNDKWKSAFVRGAKSVREWGQKMEEISRPYDVTEDDTFTSLLGEGRIGDAIKLGAATAGQSALYSFGSRYVPTAILLFRGDAANRYVDLAEEQPEMEPWRRELHANGGAAIEVLVERMGDAFRLLKGGNEEIAKRTFKEIYENAGKSLWRTLSKEILKSSVEEGGEEILTSGLTDAYDTLVDIGSQGGTGLVHQYQRFAEQMRKANPDIKISDKDMLWQFCKNKGIEYVNSFFGGFFSGGIHTSGTLLAPSTIQGLQDQKVQDQYVQQAINNIAKEDEVGTDAVIRVADGKDDTSKVMQERINTKYKEIVQNEIANSIKQDINNTRELIENRTNRMVYEVSFNDGSLKEGDSAYVIDGNVVVNTDGEKPIFDNTSSDKMVYIRIVHADGTNEVKQVAIDELDLVQNPITSEEWAQEYIDSTLEVLQQSQQPTQQEQEITTPDVVAGEQAGTQGKTYSNGQQTITASLPDANGVVTLSQPIEVGGEVTQQLPQTITDENGIYTYEQVLADLGYTPQQPAQQGQQPAQQGQQASSYPMTADGKVDWSQMDANQSMGAILERNGNNVERAKQYAERQVQAKQKALEEAKKAVEQIDIDDDAAYNAALDNVDKTQAEVDKWTAVANGIDANNAPIQPSGNISATSASGNEVVTENSAINTENPNAPNGQSVSQNGNIAAESQQASGNIQQNAQSPQGNAENVSASAENAQTVKPKNKELTEFAQRLGAKGVHVVSSEDQLPQSEDVAYRAIKSGVKVMGWFNPANNQVYIYAPNAKSRQEVFSALLHEFVSHRGLREMLGKEEFDNLCRKVWDVMSDADKLQYASYVKHQVAVNSQEMRDKLAKMSEAEKQVLLNSEYYQLAAADEYMAHIADTGVSETERTIWQKICDWVRDALRKMGVDIEINDNDIANLLRASSKRLSTDGSMREIADTIFENREKFDGLETSQVEPTLESEGFEVDDKTGDARFSVAYRLGKNQIDILAEQIAERVGVSKAKAKKWLKADTSLAALCMNEDNVAALYYFPDGRYGAIKNNSDYPQGTVDFNNICRKRLDFTNIYLKLQQEFPNKVFTAKDLETIRQIMIEDGLEVACGLCYVEDRRQLLGEIANEFRGFLKDRVIPEDLSATKKEVMQKVLDIVGDDTHIPTIYELLEAGAYTLRESHPNIFEAFVVFNNSRGMQSGRLFEGYAEYKREILDWDDKKVKKVNDAGGLRIFSFSDFEAHHLIDIVQIISDAAARGVMIQGYTKVPEFAKAIRNTKVKLNRSLIPLGDTGIQEVDGKKVLAYDPVEGIDVNSENFLDESNNPNVGNVLVGINDEQIRMAMEDANVDYIIPFHTGLKKDILLQKKIGDWVNYKNSQTEKDAATGSSKTADGKKVVGVNIYTDVLQAAEKASTPITNRKEFVEYFLQVCKERGLVPRFEQFLARGKNGEYRYTKGYEKLLVDFKMFDKRGRILPQEPVVPIFDDAFNQQIIENYVKGTKETKEYEGTTEKIRENLDLRYSISAKEQQLEIINATNPMQDDVHTGIRSVEDIHTLAETMSGELLVTTNDWSEEDIQKAIDTNKVTLYSSKPIKNGVFVTPSKMIAQDYAGNGQVYEQTTSPDNVAWIDSSEGQYADVRFSIIGEKGAAALDQAEEATTRLDNLAIAREMESANKDAKTIRMATGWERGADGKWRYEVEDVKLKDTNILNTNESVTLGDIVEDNVLFTAYPDMKDIVVDKNVSNGDLAKYNGNIGLSAELLDMPSSTIRTALIHEIQHAIQEREGYAGGVPSPNAEYFVKRKAELEKAIDALKTDYTKEQLRELAKTTNDADLRGVYVDALMQMAEGYTMDDIRKSYTDEYNGLAEQEQKSRREYVNAAGEVEARNASARANMSLEERINTLLAETEDVAREDQEFIAGYDSQEAALEMSKLDKISNFISNVLEGKSSRQKASIEIPEYVNNKAEKEIGHRISSHSISANSIRHIKRRHGINGSGNDINNIPLRDADIALLPYIMVSPSTIEEGTMSTNGTKSIRYKKNLSNGVVVVVEQEGRFDVKDMVNVTMWAEKKSATYVTVANKTSHNTSETIVISDADSLKIKQDAEEAIKKDLIRKSLSSLSADKGTKNIPNDQINSQENANLDRSDILFSISNNNQRIFISNAEKAVESIKQDKATPQQWKAMIEKQGGLKAGEDKWLGLSEWLDEKANAEITPQANETRGEYLKRANKTITKQEILDFIAKNQIKIEEVHYAEEPYANSQKLEDYRYEFELKMESVEFTMEPDEAAQFAFDQMVEEYGDDFAMAFEYDENYRLQPIEDVFGDEDAESAAAYFLNEGVKPINGVRTGYTTKGLENNHEIALTVPTVESWNENDEVHFGDAGEGRAIAWIRFGETQAETPREVIDHVDELKFAYTNANGQDVYAPQGSKFSKDYAVYGKLANGEMGYVLFVRNNQLSAHPTLEAALEALNAHYEANPRQVTEYDKVLVIDEIQSKRHQEGREKGYTTKKNRDIKKKIAELTNRQDDIFDTMRAREEGRVGIVNFTEEETAELKRLDEEIKQLQSELSANNGIIPEAPFEKNWHELAFKRILRYAAENGFDKVAWTTGAQQAERYDIGGKVERIDASLDNYSATNGWEGEDRNRAVTMYLTNSNWIDFTVDKSGIILDGEYIGNSLESVVGEEIAKKIMDITPEQYSTTIEGADLRIGGEGMKGFYDKMLPSFVSKYVKKWGAKVGEVTMPQLQEGYQTMHSVDITPEMKESVMEGQPMFSISAKEVATDIWNKYQYDGELESVRDVAEYVEEHMPKNAQTQALFDAIDAYRIEEEEDRMYYGMRGDLEPFEDAILDEVEKLMGDTEDAALEEEQVRYSIVTDEKKIAELEADEKMNGYRTVILNEDGTFSSPMATGLGNKGKKSAKTSGFELGKWEQAEERPELADENGKINLKPQKGGDTYVDYNPYIHNRLDKINTQFTSAWRKPFLVYIETEIPMSDINSEYHAEKAALPVGVHPWNGGDLVLSRYDKPVRVVPWEEVADAWAEKFDEVTFDIVNPDLLPLLQERGVVILPPKKAAKEKALKAYQEWIAEHPNPRFSIKDNENLRMSGESVNFANDYRWGDKMLDADYIDQEGFAEELELFEDAKNIKDELEAAEMKAYALMQFYDKIADSNDKPIVIPTYMDVRYYLTESGMDENTAMAFQMEVIDTVNGGDIVKGVHYNGKIAIIGEFVYSLIDAQSTYAHELQHKDNKRNADAVVNAIKVSNPQELVDFVNALQGDGMYDDLLKKGADGFRALADEAIAFGVQYGYRLGENGNLAEALRESGLTNEKLINIITNEYERQKESHGNLVQNNRKGNSRNDNKYNPRGRRANEAVVQGESKQVGKPNGHGLVQSSERTRKDVARSASDLQKLRNEAVKIAYGKLLKAEPMRESGVRFSISSAPTSQPTETQGEYVKRFRAWWDGQIEERARREYIQQTKEASKWGWIGKKIADRNKPIEAFQRIIVGQGGKLDVSNNAYGDTTMAIGRAGYQVRKFADNQMRRMIDAINALINSGRLDGIDLRWSNMDTAYTEKGKEINGKRLTVRELIGVYCQAMDVQEAIQKNLPDRGEEGFKKNLTDASGNEVTYDEVIRLVHDAVSGTTLTKTLWSTINDATKFALRYQLAHGLISQETFDQFIDRNYYVPERGWRERDLNGKKDHYVEGNGMLNGSPYNAALKKAKGRESLASDPFAYIQSIAESSIMSVEKNRVKQKFLKFLLDNDEIGRKTGAWRIKKVYVVKDGVDANGNVITKTTYEKPANENDIVSMVSLDENLPPVTHGERLQHRVTVVQDGQQYVIELENEELANTLNGNYGDDVNLLGETWSNWQRNMVNYMSAINTQYNPVFPIWNFVRDFQLALVSNLAEQDAKFAGQFMKNIGKVQGAIWKYVANEKYRGIEVFKATPMGRYLQEYFEQGAQTGFSFLRDIESLNEDIDKMINPSAWEKTKDIMGHTVGATLSMMTEVSELTVRVAQYVTAREMGKSAEEAAQMAKEISVNFDRKGTLSGSLAKLYSFFNASIQGTNKILRMMKDKKTRRKLEGAFLLFFALGILNTLCNPDDPEEESWNSDYSRKTNYILGRKIVGLFGKKFEGIRIPVPHFFRIFYGAGVDVVLYAQGRKTLKQAIWDTADFTLDELIPASFLQVNNFGEYNEVLNKIEFNPAQYIQGAAPSYLSPITDVWMNRDFMGGNINKEPFIRGEEEHYKAGKYAMTNTPKAYIAVADFLSGGDSSAIRKKGEGKGVSGSTLQHIVEGYAGGTGKTIADLGHLIYKAVHPKEDVSLLKDIPIVNKAFKPYQAEKAYSQEYWELYRKVKHYKKELDDAKKNNKEEYYKMKNSPEYKIYQKMNYLIKNKPKADEKYSAEDVKELMNANQLWNDKM